MPKTDFYIMIKLPKSARLKDDLDELHILVS